MPRHAAPRRHTRTDGSASSAPRPSAPRPPTAVADRHVADRRAARIRPAPRLVGAEPDRVRLRDLAQRLATLTCRAASAWEDPVRSCTSAMALR
jgi:hypothetical protein